MDARCSLGGLERMTSEYSGAPPTICDLNNEVVVAKRWQSDPGDATAAGEISYGRWPFFYRNDSSIAVAPGG